MEHKNSTAVGAVTHTRTRWRSHETPPNPPGPGVLSGLGLACMAERFWDQDHWFLQAPGTSA